MRALGGGVQRTRSSDTDVGVVWAASVSGDAFGGGDMHGDLLGVAVCLGSAVGWAGSDTAVLPGSLGTAIGGGDALDALLAVGVTPALLVFA